MGNFHGYSFLLVENPLHNNALGDAVVGGGGEGGGGGEDNDGGTRGSERWCVDRGGGGRKPSCRGIPT